MTSPPVAPPAPLRLPLHRPGLLASAAARTGASVVAVLTFLAIYLAGGLTFINGANGDPLAQRAAALAAAGAAGIAVALALRWLVRREQVPPIVADDHGITLPLNEGSGLVQTIAWSEAPVIERRGHWWPALAVTGARQRYVFRLSAIDHQDPVAALREVAQRHLELSPAGAELAAHGDRVRQAVEARRPIVTAGLVAFTLTMLGAQAGRLGSNHVFGAVSAGANAPSLVEAGEVFRLLTSTHAHASVAMGLLAAAALGSTLR